MAVQLTQEMIQGAQQTERLTGVPSSITLSQIIEESSGKYDGGLSYLAYKGNNLFGVKSFSDSDEKIYVRNSEGLVAWKKYDSQYDSIIDHAKILTLDRYKSRYKNASSVSDYAQALQDGGYAGNSTTYADKLMNHIDTYNLNQYNLDNSKSNNNGDMILNLGSDSADSLTGGIMSILNFSSNSNGYVTSEDMFFNKYEITSPYGTRTNPTNTAETETHNGVDYAVPLNTPIYSNVTGVVEKSSYDADGYGNYVVIRDGYGRMHYYAHLNESSVNVGESIKSGEVIGLSGSTGRSTGAHLHYEIRDESGNTLNPEEHADDEIVAISTAAKSMSGGLWGAFTSGIETVKNSLDIIGHVKSFIFNFFKFIITTLLIILCVVFITKSLDLDIFN